MSRTIAEAASSETGLLGEAILVLEDGKQLVPSSRTASKTEPMRNLAGPELNPIGAGRDYL